MMHLKGKSVSFIEHFSEESASVIYEYFLVFRLGAPRIFLRATRVHNFAPSFSQFTSPPFSYLLISLFAIFITPTCVNIIYAQSYSGVECCNNVVEFN